MPVLLSTTSLKCSMKLKSPNSCHPWNQLKIRLKKMLWVAGKPADTWSWWYSTNKTRLLVLLVLNYSEYFFYSEYFYFFYFFINYFRTKSWLPVLILIPSYLLDKTCFKNWRWLVPLKWVCAQDNEIEKSNWSNEGFTGHLNTKL